MYICSYLFLTSRGKDFIINNPANNSTKLKRVLIL